MEPRLHRDTQTLGDAVYVVEVGDDLGGARYPLIVQAGRAKPRDVPGVHSGRRSRQLLGVLAQCDICGTKTSRPPVDCNPINLALVFDLSPEVV